MYSKHIHQNTITKTNKFLNKTNQIFSTPKSKPDVKDLDQAVELQEQAAIQAANAADADQKMVEQTTQTEVEVGSTSKDEPKDQSAKTPTVAQRVTYLIEYMTDGFRTIVRTARRVEQ